MKPEPIYNRVCGTCLDRWAMGNPIYWGYVDFQLCQPCKDKQARNKQAKSVEVMHPRKKLYRERKRLMVAE